MVHNLPRKGRTIVLVVFVCVLWKVATLVHNSASNKANPTRAARHTTNPLPWSERMRFVRPRDLVNITYWRTRKPTPSGWWPNVEWIHNCTSNGPQTFPLQPFDTLPRFRNYRLGDCVRMCNGCCPKLNGTIAQRFFELGCAKRKVKKLNKRQALLHKVVDKLDGKPHFIIPEADTIVLHLRLGDYIEKSQAQVFDMLHNSAEPEERPVWKGVKAIKSVYEILTGIVESNASKVSIRGGSHKAEQYMKSKLYAYCVKDAVDRAGYNVTIQLDEGNPDFDFYFLSHAKMAIISLGGYSHFVGQSVLNRGGRLFGRVLGMGSNAYRLAKG